MCRKATTTIEIQSTGERASPVAWQDVGPPRSAYLGVALQGDVHARAAAGLQRRSGWAFGSITLSTDRTVTGGSVIGPDGDTELISSDDVVVNGIMSPDKTMIVAAFRLRATATRISPTVS